MAMPGGDCVLLCMATGRVRTEKCQGQLTTSDGLNPFAF